MGDCITCSVKTKELSLQEVTNMIRFNVGSIIYLEQVKPTGHRYALEVISPDLIVVHNKTTGHNDTVDLTEFQSKFGLCKWARLDAINW